MTQSVRGSFPSFLDRFASEDDCIQHVMVVRWPEGPVCPHCGAIGKASHHSRRKRKLTCNAAGCRRQFSVTDGTALRHTRLPLQAWFRAIHFIEASGGSVKRMELARHLKISHHTAQAILDRLPNLRRDVVFKEIFVLAGRDRAKAASDDG